MQRKELPAQAIGQVQGPEGSLFDIADHPWIGAALVKQAAE